MTTERPQPISLSKTSLNSSFYRRYSSVSCDNSIYGCPERFYTLEERKKHLCEFEPNIEVKCENCQIQIQRSQLKRHNCIQELRTNINELKDVINKLEAKVNQQLIRMNEDKQILEALPQKVVLNEEINDESDGFNHYFNGNNEPKEEIFESEPQETQRQVSSDFTELPEKGSYRRFNKQISEEVDFPMYGSKKYKYLAQLSRNLDGTVPPIDYQNDYTIELDLKMRNKEKLIDIIKEEDSGDKPSLIRLRSWSERD